MGGDDIVQPSWDSSPITLRTSPTSSGSSAEVGSSKSSTWGRIARRTDDADALLLATGELGGVAVVLLEQSDTGQQRLLLGEGLGAVVAADLHWPWVSPGTVHPGSHRVRPRRRPSRTTQRNPMQPFTSGSHGRSASAAMRLSRAAATSSGHGAVRRVSMSMWRKISSIT